jgi:hypothetical protein
MSTSKSCFVYMHIPKAGGLTIHSVLEKIYPRNKRFATKGMWHGNQDLLSTREEDRRAIQCLHGHLSFGIHDRIMCEYPAYSAVFREPISRVKSAYYNILNDPTHFLYSNFKSYAKGISDIHETKIWKGLDNCQVRMLSNTLNLPYGEIGEVQYEQAKLVLEKHFKLIGTMPNIDMFIVRLCQYHNFPIPKYRILHRSGKASVTANYSDSDELIIADMNKWDAKLYRLAMELEVLQISKQLSELKELTAAYRKNTDWWWNIKSILSTRG